MIVRELINLIGFKLNEGQFRAAEAGVNKMTRSMQNFGLKATFFLTAPFIGLNLWLAKTFSGFEQMEVAFETMLGSAEKADKLIHDMMLFAAKTPFEVNNIGTVVKQLLATGSSAEQVIDDLRILGNAASGLSQPITRLALNFGQVRAQGKLTGRDMRDFTVAGINMRKELKKIVGAGADIDKMVRKGEISFDQVREAFVKMSAKGGIFHNLMVKQAKTLGGLWSNFKDIVVLTAKEFSDDLLPGFKKIVLFFLEMVSVFKNDVSPTMKKTLFIIGALLAIIGPLTLALTILISVGKVLASTFILISGAAKAAHLSTLAFMAKFLLIGLAVVAVFILSLALFDELMTKLRGGKTVLDEITIFLDKLQKKLDSMNVFVLGNFRSLIKALSDILDNFFLFIIQLFTGRWKEALTYLVDTLTSVLGFAAKQIEFLFQPILDIINLITKKSFDIGGVFSKGSELFSKENFAKIGQSVSPGAIGANISQTVAPSIQNIVNVTVGEGTPGGDIAEKVSAVVKKTVLGVINNQVRFMTHSLPEVE